MKGLTVIMGMSLNYLAVFAGGCVLGWFIADGQAGNPWPLVLWVLLWVIGYPISLRRHPRRNCWHCNGTGRHTGLIFGYARRKCTACHGAGWKLRWGAARLGLTGDSPSKLT
jgi:hypothetical protein